MEIVASRGVRAVTLAAVGEAAGYSRGIVTHQFGSRSGLLDALTLDLQNRFVPPETDDVIELVDAYLSAFETRPLDTRVYAVLWAEAQAGDPDLGPAFAERDARFVGDVDRLPGRELGPGGRARLRCCAAWR